MSVPTSQPLTWIELLETIFFSWSKMTICLINFPTKKLPVKVPPIVTTVSHSSLHWTLSLLSKSCDKVKFKHPDFVEKFAMDGKSVDCGLWSVIDTNSWTTRDGSASVHCPVKVLSPHCRQYFDTFLLSISLSFFLTIAVEISRNARAELHGVNQANHQPPTPSGSFQGVTKFLGLEWLVFIQRHWGEWSNLMAGWGYCETLHSANLSRSGQDNYKYSFVFKSSQCIQIVCFFLIKMSKHKYSCNIWVEQKYLCCV